MSRLNFSPGPWKKIPLPEASVIYIESLGGHVVCQIPTYYKQRAPKYNAQIIEKAPEMFKLLQTIKNQINAEHFGEEFYKKLTTIIEQITRI